MKMIIAIVNDEDSERVSHALTDASFRVTTIASTGAFLRRGQSTLICAVEDAQLEDALSVMQGCYPPVTEDSQKRCKVFVLNIADYHHF